MITWISDCYPDDFQCNTWIHFFTHPHQQRQSSNDTVYLGCGVHDPDTVNAELSLAASEVRFLQNANETAAREYDAVGESIADLHVFIGALKAKDEAMKPKLDAILAIEGEVDALETLARAVDKRVSALELRLKSIKSKRASAT